TTRASNNKTTRKSRRPALRRTCGETGGAAVEVAMGRDCKSSIAVSTIKHSADGEHKNQSELCGGTDFAFLRVPSWPLWLAFGFAWVVAKMVFVAKMVDIDKSGG